MKIMSLETEGGYGKAPDNLPFVGGGGAGTPGPRSHIATGTAQIPAGRPADALSTAHADSLTALTDAVAEMRRQHAPCKTLAGWPCPWTLLTAEDVEHLHGQLTDHGYQVVPL